MEPRAFRLGTCSCGGGEPPARGALLLFALSQVFGARMESVLGQGTGMT